MNIIDIDSDNKPIAPGTLSPEQHQAKQRGMPRWKPFLGGNTNPDIYVLEGKLVVRLLDASVQSKKSNPDYSDYTVYEAKGHYYGLLD
ncbi:hypothetical protein [Xanthomonas cannabis]|uniref:hypothetical protein n=1 Tax=Xanthomonas cannabis TaxID=1885674 RepID=UPI0005732822|nr:hypothetical protein [Xanthomonas cannabis]KHL54931.1 hypothetical protein OZ13_12685 [Xanthomonas cannabis pv. cannabis]